MTHSSNSNIPRPSTNSSGRFRFSLGYLVLLTAVVAAWTAAFVARQNNLELQPKREMLVSLSSRLNVVDPDELAYVSLPNIAGDFESWDVYLPAGKPQELRFHCGDVSVGGLPQEFESGPLSPGRHRVVFRVSDSAKELYRYQVYVDGLMVIEKQMGSDWMPNGWRQRQGCNVRGNDAASQYLTGGRYQPRVDFGSNEYFKGEMDDWSTEPGYLLWIDEVGRSPKPIDAFLGIGDQSYSEKIGFRDGLRLNTKAKAIVRANFGKTLVNYDLMFTHPATGKNDPVLNVELEFLIDQKVVLSDQTAKFTGWQLSDSADQIGKLNWKRDPTIQSRSAFLHGGIRELGGLEPVIELRWSKDRPDEIGFRLPQVPANAGITSWRLRCTDGLSHLWRIIESGDLKQDSRTIGGQAATDPEVPRTPIKLADADEGMQSVRWRTDIKLPLQIYERKTNTLAGGMLYEGMPFQFGCDFSESASAKVWVACEDKWPGVDNTPILGGNVFTEVVIELDAADPDWVWLRAAPR